MLNQQKVMKRCGREGSSFTKMHRNATEPGKNTNELIERSYGIELTAEAEGVFIEQKHILNYPLYLCKILRAQTKEWTTSNICCVTRTDKPDYAM